MRPFPIAGARCLEEGHDGGWFEVVLKGRTLRVVASFGGGWDHVSVSLKTRVPSWREMEYVKRLFFEDHEWAIQLHAPPAEHINIHPNTLHLWRSQAVPMTLPPEWMV